MTNIEKNKRRKTKDVNKMRHKEMELRNHV